MDIVVNNIKINYEILGEGKPIILLNPNTVNTGIMKFIANRLKDKYKVYIFDRRCCGCFFNHSFLSVQICLESNLNFDTTL